MKFRKYRDIVIAFLTSAASGFCLSSFIYSDPASLVASFTFCLGLIPFLLYILRDKKSIRFFAFLGLSLPVSLVVGEGLWCSLHVYYQVPFLPSVIVFTGWVWLAGCLFWMVYSLFCKSFLCPGPDQLWLFPFGWMTMEFIYGRISIQGQSIALGFLGPLNSLSKIFIKAGGVHAASFFYVCVNVFILVLIHPNWRKSSLKKRWMIPWGFLLVIALTSFFFKREERLLDKPLHIALLQPNLTILRQEKFDQTTQQRLEKLIGMTKTAYDKKVNLIVWPAAVMSIKDNLEVSYVMKMISEKDPSEIKILLGVIRTVTDKAKEKLQNTIYLVNTQGRIENVYVKQKLTPYTEYIPFSILDFAGRQKQGILPFLSSTETDIVFAANEIKWGNPICIEIYYPNLLRKYIRQGAHFLVHFSNDDVFGTAHFKKLIVKLSVLRAVELGVPIFRESINGISAWIGSEGEIMEHLPSGEEGIVYATLARKTQPTFYARFGDVFSYMSLCITAWGIWNVRRQKKH